MEGKLWDCFFLLIDFLFTLNNNYFHEKSFHRYHREASVAKFQILRQLAMKRIHCEQEELLRSFKCRIKCPNLRWDLSSCLLMRKCWDIMKSSEHREVQANMKFKIAKYGIKKRLIVEVNWSTLRIFKLNSTITTRARHPTPMDRRNSFSKHSTLSKIDRLHRISPRIKRSPSRRSWNSKKKCF